MSAKKSRLGRGLDSLISGGVTSQGTVSAAAPQKRAVKAGKSVPASKTARKRAVKKSIAKERPGKTEAGSRAREDSPKRAEPEAAGLREISIRLIDPNPHQPRRDFDEVALAELADSIRAEGLLQPIVVRAVGERFQLIAGERRFRACQRLKLKSVPARVVESSDTSSAILSLVENLQREDLNPIEEAGGYASLIREFGLTQESVAERVGKARASIANALRLLQLDKEIQGFIGRGHLSTGHAKVLLGVESPDTRLLVARQIIEHGWSVRETERQVERSRRKDSDRFHPRHPVPAAEQTAIRDLEKHISNSLGTPVLLKHSPKKGKLIIEYFGNDDLQRLLARMGLES